MRVIRRPSSKLRVGNLGFVVLLFATAGSCGTERVQDVAPDAAPGGRDESGWPVLIEGQGDLPHGLPGVISSTLCDCSGRPSTIAAAVECDDEVWDMGLPIVDVRCVSARDWLVDDYEQVAAIYECWDSVWERGFPSTERYEEGQWCTIGRDADACMSCLEPWLDALTDCGDLREFEWWTQIQVCARERDVE